jgi:hypothetical protein
MQPNRTQRRPVPPDLPGVSPVELAGCWAMYASIRRLPLAGQRGDGFLFSGGHYLGQRPA